MRPPATKLLGFAPKASTAWAGNFYGTDDAVIISVPSLGEGFLRNATFCTSWEVKGRVTSRSHNSLMPACPLYHSRACPERHRAKRGRDTVGLQERCEWTLCLSLGTGIASSFASSGVLRTRMSRSAFEPGARACGWAMRGMRSAVLLPWRRCGGAVCASALRCRCRFLFAVAIPKRQTRHRSNPATRCAGGRAIAAVDSRGHAHRGQRSQQSDKMERRLLSGLKAGAPNVA
jgi:hypothetical protein